MKYPLCEVCGKNESVSLSAFGVRRWLEDRDRPVEWKLACECSADSEEYYIQFDRFAASQPWWLSHMREKIWFKDGPFIDCVKRACLNLPKRLRDTLFS